MTKIGEICFVFVVLYIINIKYVSIKIINMFKTLLLISNIYQYKCLFFFTIFSRYHMSTYYFKMMYEILITLYRPFKIHNSCDL